MNFKEKLFNVKNTLENVDFPCWLDSHMSNTNQLFVNYKVVFDISHSLQEENKPLWVSHMLLFDLKLPQSRNRYARILLTPYVWYLISNKQILANVKEVNQTLP